MPADEQIAHVPLHTLRALDLPPVTYRPDPDATIHAHLLTHARFGTRGPLEEDPSHRQLIPYVILGSARGVFMTRRLAAGAEARLHDRLSLGIGGHINPQPDSPHDLITAGMLQELTEELHGADDLTPTYRGVLQDERTPVGQVHLGLIYSCWVHHPDPVHVRETHKLAGQWLPLADVRAQAEGLESWSALLLDAIEGWF